MFTWNYFNIKLTHETRISALLEIRPLIVERGKKGMFLDQIFLSSSFLNTILSIIKRYSHSLSGWPESYFMSNEYVAEDGKGRNLVGTTSQVLEYNFLYYIGWALWPQSHLVLGDDVAQDDGYAKRIGRAGFEVPVALEHT